MKETSNFKRTVEPNFYDDDDDDKMLKKSTVTGSPVDVTSLSLTSAKPRCCPASSELSAVSQCGL